MGNGEACGMRLTFVRQDEPEGTARRSSRARRPADEPLRLGVGDVLVRPATRCDSSGCPARMARSP
jgi:dTDP-glucose pyrophosphorylase